MLSSIWRKKCKTVNKKEKVYLNSITDGDKYKTVYKILTSYFVTKQCLQYLADTYYTVHYAYTTMLHIGLCQSQAGGPWYARVYSKEKPQNWINIYTFIKKLNTPWNMHFKLIINTSIYVIPQPMTTEAPETKYNITVSPPMI